MMERQSNMDEENIAKVFTEADIDKDGMIGAKALNETLHKLGERIDDRTLEDLLKRSGIEFRVESSDEPLINLGMFLSLVRRLTNDRQQKAELKHAFDEFDGHNKGYIDGPGIERILTKLNIEHTREEIELMMEVADTNDDGKVDFDEFIQIFNRPEDIDW